MSSDHCAHTDCSLDTGGDSGICTETAVCSDTITCVETMHLSQNINSVANDGNVPISIDDIETQAISDGCTPRAENSRCSKYAHYLTCIRFVVFILVIVVFVLICKKIICYAVMLKLLRYRSNYLSYVCLCFFSGFKAENY